MACLLSVAMMAWLAGPWRLITFTAHCLLYHGIDFFTEIDSWTWALFCKHVKACRASIKLCDVQDFSIWNGSFGEIKILGCLWWIRLTKFTTSNYRLTHLTTDNKWSIMLNNRKFSHFDCKIKLNKPLSKFFLQKYFIL